MGLFDKALGGQSSRDAALDPRAAFAGILMVTVAGDGYVSEEEAEEFIAISNRMQLFKGQSGPEFNAMIGELQALLAKQGPEFLLEKSVEALPAELHETAFAVAADLVFADGSIEDEEKTVLEALQAALGIEENLAIKIVDVVAIKNRG